MPESPDPPLFFMRGDYVFNTYACDNILLPYDLIPVSRHTDEKGLATRGRVY